MKCMVIGATGFVGTALCRHLLLLRHEIVAVGRRAVFDIPENESCRYVRADVSSPEKWQLLVRQVDVVINLAGESVLHRWNDSNRKRMWHSRVETTRDVVRFMGSGQTLINVSATGVYGDCGAKILDESSEAGTGFLCDLCREWERQAKMAAEMGIRVVIARLGIVLGQGGALEKMLSVFRLGMGGRLGSGHQWMPWVHIDDVTRALATMMENSGYSGVFNISSPNPVTNRMFTETLGKILNVPTLAPIPGMVLSMIFGEASRVLLDSQRARPIGLLDKGFVFRFTEIRDALSSLVHEEL